MRLQVRVPKSAPVVEGTDRRAVDPLEAVLAERGRPLEPEVRAELEARFGRDLGHVRVHADGGADAAARAHGARALAVGGHVVFAAGELRPGTLDGRRLLAHEVAHAIQGANALRLDTAGDARPGDDPDVATPPARLAVAGDDDAAETAARQASGLVTRNRPDGAGGPTLPVPLPVRTQLPSTGHGAPILAPPGGRVASAGLAAPALGGAVIHRFPAAAPVRDAAAPLADPVVELMAVDVARALEADPSDAAGRSRRRIGRMGEALRAAVVTRVGELLTPGQREAAVRVLTSAAVGEADDAAVGRAPARPNVQAPRVSTATAVASATASSAAPAAAAAGATSAAAQAATAVASATASSAAPAAAGATSAAAHAAASTTGLASVPERPASEAAASRVEPAVQRAVHPEGAAATVEAAAVDAATQAGAEAGQPGQADTDQSTQGQEPGGPGAAPASATQPATRAAAPVVAPSAGGEARPDLTPFDALETRLAERERVAQAAQAAASHAAATTTTPAPGSPAPAADTMRPADAAAALAGDEAAAPAAGEAGPFDATATPEAGSPAESAGGAGARTVAAARQDPEAGAGEVATATGAAAHASTVAQPDAAMPPAGAPVPETPAEQAVDNPAAPGSDLSPEDVALAAQPAPATTPEVEAAVASAQEADQQAEDAAARRADATPAVGVGTQASPGPVLPALVAPASTPGVSVVASTSSAAAAAVTAASPETEPAMSAAGVSSATAPAAVSEGPAAMSDGRAAAADAASPEAATVPAGFPEDTTAIDAPAGAAPETGAADAVGVGSPSPAGGGAVMEGAAPGDCGPDPASGGAEPGTAIPEQSPEPAVDVAGQTPTDAMGRVAALPPAEAAAALSGVQTASSGAVADRRAELAAAPPSMDRPAGSPETRQAGAAAVTARRSDAAPAGPAPLAPIASTGGGSATVTSALPPEPAPVTGIVATPAVAGGPQGQVTAADAQALQASVDEVPVTDPALAVNAGPAPTVDLAGDADPANAVDRRHQLEDRTREADEAGRADTARPLGENDIYPTVPSQTLVADPAPGASAAAGAATSALAAGATAAATDEATAIVARVEHPDDVRTAATTARGDMVTGEQDRDRREAEGRADTQRQIDDQVRTNAEQQAGERGDARAQVAHERTGWTDAQRDEVDRGSTDADGQLSRSTTDIETEREQGDRAAAGHIEDGNQRATTVRQDAEHNAAVKRDEARHESRGVLGWLADKARSFFEGLRRGIRAIFDGARSLVRRAITAAQELATRAIDAARRRIVGLIRAVGDGLVAIADRVLAAFPALRERFRAAIERVVDAAVAAVNRLADALAAGIRRALGLLGQLLDSYLGLLESVYLAAVNVVAGAVQGAIRAAQAVVQIIGQFAVIIRDVAADPGGWLHNLGAGILDGLRNHVWRELKCAVRAWFDAKVEEILGLGRMIFQVLRSGGIHLAEIGRMVWEALKAALPGIAIQLAIEKLVSLLVPAASALMLIIDGVKAAWGAISRIIAAIETFIRFLRAVRSGTAGRPFAQALAAGAVALIDFLANFLVGRLKGPASGVGGRLGGIAARLGRVGSAVTRVAGRAARVVRRIAPRLARLARRVGGVVVASARGMRRGFRAVRETVRGGVRAVRRGVVAGAQAVRRGVVAAAQAVRRVVVSGARAVGRAVAGAAGSVGRRIVATARAAIASLARRFPRVAAAIRRARDTWRRARQRFQQWRERRRQRRGQGAQERLDRAVAAIRPSLEAHLASGLSGWRLTGRLLWWQIRWALSSLALRGSHIVARINPSAAVTEAALLRDAEIGHALEPILEEAESAFLSSLSSQTAPGLEAARTGLESGDATQLMRLTSAQQVIVLRDIRSGVTGVGTGRIQLGGGVAMQAFAPSNLAQFVIHYPRASGARRMLPTGGTYEELHGSVRRLGAGLGVPERRIMDLASSRDEATLLGQFGRLTAGLPADRQALAARDLLPVARGLRFHTQALEPARAFGMLPVAQIAGRLGTDSTRLLDPRRGRYAPMAFEKSSSAPQARRRELEAYPEARPLDARQREAETVRRARAVRVFRELARSARRGRIRTLPGEEGRALRALAEAFRAWLRAHVSGRDPRALDTARADLALELIAFMNTFEGRP